MHHVRGKIIDLPEDAVFFMLNDSEIMLSVWIIVTGEIIKGFHLLTDSGFNMQGQGIKPFRLHQPSGSSHSLAAQIVKFSYAFRVAISHFLSSLCLEVALLRPRFGACTAGSLSGRVIEFCCARNAKQGKNSLLTRPRCLLISPE
jgi:hypothetical protein